VKPIRSAPELYAHAIAIEQEAAERYAELSQRMEDLGNEAVAAVFGTLARFETEHLLALEHSPAGVALPELHTDEYRWLDSGAPESPARELVFRLMTPRHALAIALAAEKRALAFFEGVLTSVQDPALRSLARAMAADELEHVRLLEQLLERTPNPEIDWASVYQTN
jgi:rubrerythrin